MPLDPHNLTPNAGINRTKLISAPGLLEEWTGKTAFQVMGHYTLVERIHKAFPQLSDQPDPVPAFNQSYLAQQHPAALAVADEMGLALGCLLLILKQGEPANRAGRPEWDDSYWAHWGSIQHIIFGGGIMASLLGKHMLTYAARMLDGLPLLTIADYPTVLPLIGAARMTTELIDSAWVFDFGGTNVKRGRASYSNKCLTGLDQLPSIAGTVFDEPQNTFNFMVDSVATTISRYESRLDRLQVNVSIANYVQQCQLAPDTPYGRMSVLGENICQLLSEAIMKRVGCPIEVAFVHDGTAAAKTYAGVANTAVITVGTAFGIGFPPPAQTVCPLADHFSVRQTPDL